MGVIDGRRTDPVVNRVVRVGEVMICAIRLLPCAFIDASHRGRRGIE
jgi:hypothetical protein